MPSREDAVMWLRARGLHAFVRDWAPGQTVGVAARAMESSPGITELDRLMYLIPGPGGAWIVEDLSTRENFTCEDLQRAAEFAAERLET